MNMLLPIQSFQVEMTIVQGRNLVAKDRNLFGQRTKSDPYVVVFLGMDHKLGKTKTCQKTLNPVWNSTFHFTVPNQRHAQVPVNMSTFLQHSNTTAGDEMMEACGMLLLKLYDQDTITDDDCMGSLVVPIPVCERSGLTTRKWYTVDNLFVPNAVGDLEIQLKIEPELGKPTFRCLIPSPQTLARWMYCSAGKQQTVNEHNVVVESDPYHRKNYVLEIFKQFSQ